MALIQAYKDFLRVGLETTFGVEAASFLDLRARPWSLRNNPTRVYPEGERVGTRDMDSQVSVPGRRWAAGDVPTFWRSDTGPLLLLAALGAETVAASPVGATTRKKHLVRCADVPPTLTVQNFMGAVSSAAEKAYEHLGCAVDRFTITWNATDDANLLDLTYSLIGLYGQRIAKPSFSPSAWTAMPGWNATVTRGGSSSAKIRELTATFENNVARVKSGVGSRDDQQYQFGGRRFSGTMTLLYDDETEYDMFEAGGQEAVVLAFRDTYFIETVTAVDYTGGFDILIPKFTYVDYGREEQDGYYIQRLGFRGTTDSGIGGPVAFDCYNSHAAY